MTHISKLVGRIADQARTPSPPPAAVAPLTPVAWPQLSPELRALVQTVHTGPDRYGALNKHDPGFRLANQVGVEFHPDAEHTAALLRAARERRIEVTDILQWLEPIAGMVPNPPADESKARAFATGLAMSECGRFPYVVWEDALSEALTAFGFWPSGKEVRDLLARYDGRQLAEIRALETIAKGRKGPPPESARKSTVPYRPRAYLGEQAQRGPALHPTADEIPATVRTPEQQLIELGEATEELVAAVRRMHGQ